MPRAARALPLLQLGTKKQHQAASKSYGRNEPLWTKIIIIAMGGGERSKSVTVYAFLSALILTCDEKNQQKGDGEMKWWRMWKDAKSW